MNAHKTLKKYLTIISNFEKNGLVDWSTAENLAFGTLLTEVFGQIIRTGFR